MRRVINWEKWTNPLGGGREYLDQNDLDGTDVADVDPWGGDGEPQQTSVRAVMPTAGGFLPINVYGNFAANFNLWMMHTNFTITPVVMLALKRIPGVEMLDVVSRYRARVGFGKCFPSSQVKWAIQEEFNAHPPRKDEENPAGLVLDDVTRLKVDTLKAGAGSHPYWAIYVLPNGEVAHIYTDQGATHVELLSLYRQAQTLAGGVIFTSHD